MNQGQIAKIECTGCKKLLDGFTDVEGDAAPQDEDLSICVYCATIGKYSNNVTSLIPLTKEELSEIKTSDPEFYKQFIDYINMSLKSELNIYTCGKINIQKALEIAVAEEDYIKAAKIRDIIEIKQNI